MNSYLSEFTEYLAEKKALARNSLLAYERDVRGFYAFLQEKGITDFRDVTKTEVVAYLLALKNQDKSAATVNRKLASLRAFFQYLESYKGFAQDPTEGIKSPKIERKKLEYLTVEEVEKLLAQPDDSVKGRRDRALLEVLYASGMRVSEVAAIDLPNINLRIGFIMTGQLSGKPRIIPLGRPARAALETYIYEARPVLLRNRESEEQALFVNYNGERLTRQGIWKIIKENAKAVNLETKITPKTLRNSFAVHMIQNGADLKTLQELLGHEDLTATQVYLSFSKNRIKDVYDNTHPRA
ncbi:MAG: tyrosine recombinase [Bacillota bacterium]|jgi:integrase/recombinase XerD|nr:tyrosine recombinase [Bacillota bacterium]NLM08810.1 tyrosine recombinase [Clostridiales Family XIII bacterium]